MDTRIVTRERFFAEIGKLNVHPTPVGPCDIEWGYRSDWKTPEGRVLGVTVGGTHAQETVYLLPA